MIVHNLITVKIKPTLILLLLLLRTSFVLEQMFKKATYIKAYAFLKMISEGKFSFNLLF